MRSITFSEGEIYHVYNRGTDKRLIFHDIADWKRFQMLMYRCNQDNRINLSESKHRTEFDLPRSGEPLVELLAYCLMPNHYHLLLRPVQDDGVARFMQKLITAYTMYFNKKYRRTGVLFQGKYKAIHVDSDNYFRHLVSYIHLNPVMPRGKEGDGAPRNFPPRKLIEAQLKKYHFSSYLDWIQERKEGAVLTKAFMLQQFPKAVDIAGHVLKWYDEERAIEFEKNWF